MPAEQLTPFVRQVVPSPTHVFGGFIFGHNTKRFWTVCYKRWRVRSVAPCARSLLYVHVYCVLRLLPETFVNGENRHLNRRRGRIKTAIFENRHLVCGDNAQLAAESEGLAVQRLSAAFDVVLLLWNNTFFSTAGNGSLSRRHLRRRRVTLGENYCRPSVKCRGCGTGRGVQPTAKSSRTCAWTATHWKCIYIFSFLAGIAPPNLRGLGCVRITGNSNGRGIFVRQHEWTCK